MNLGTSDFSFPMRPDPVVPVARQIAAYEARAARLPRLKQEVQNLRERIEGNQFALEMGLISPEQFDNYRSAHAERIEAVALELTCGGQS